MKAVLAIEHGMIPPTIGLTNLNPKSRSCLRSVSAHICAYTLSVDFEGTRVRVVTEMTVWPIKPFRRVSINSFGYGGANAHAILDHADAVLSQYETNRALKNRIVSHYVVGEMTDDDRRLLDVLNYSPGPVNSKEIEASKMLLPSSISSVRSFPRKLPSAHAASRPVVLLPFSAKTDASLKSIIEAVGAVTQRFRAADIAYSLASRRSRFASRAFVLAGTTSGLNSFNAESLTFGRTGIQAKKIAFVFTGMSRCHSARFQCT